MRTKPIGTGPFKFVEFKQNEGIKLARNPDYWKKGQPYLDGIEFTIVPNRGDGDAELRLRPLRHDLPLGRDDPAAEGHQGAGCPTRSARSRR